MTLYHAVALVDHASAQVLQFDASQVVERKIHSHKHVTRQHASGVRDEHEFFAAICDAMEGIEEVVVTGHHTGLADFRHFVEKHRPHLATHITGYEVVDHPTDNQLVAFARAHFAKFDQMAGSVTASKD
jgi:stalled ribosome rescue protein Dom34